MIYLFRKFNGQITMATGAAAWELYSSDGQWKHRPQYLGAVTEQFYRQLKAALQAQVPIDPALYSAVNKGDQSKDAPLRSATSKRRKLEATLYEELVAAADRTEKPRNMNVINRDALKPHEQKALDKLIAGA
jgi:hypothetical protein